MEETIKQNLHDKYIFITRDEYNKLPMKDRRSYRTTTRMQIFSDYELTNGIIEQKVFLRILASISCLVKTTKTRREGDKIIKGTIRYVLAKKRIPDPLMKYSCQKCPVKLQFVDISDEALKYINCKCGGEFILSIEI